MNSQHEQFLNLKTLPARVRAEEAALLLGFSANEIPILVASGLMKPLGHPPVTGVKYFATSTVEELKKDEKWLAKASDCIVEYWRAANRNRKRSCSDRNHNEPGRHGSVRLQPLDSRHRSTPREQAATS